MSQFLRKIYWKLEKMVVPELTSSQNHYKRMLFESLPGQKFAWLDLGCGHQVFADWMDADEREMVSKAGFAVGVDADFASLKAHKGFRNKVCGDISQIPLRESLFDVVTANMVVEHVSEPEKVLSEIHRVLRDGGIFVFHTTNASNPLLWAASKIPQTPKNWLIYALERRKAEDVYPTCYKINRLEEVKDLAARAGFVVDRLEAVSTSAATQLITPLAIIELLFIRMLRRKSLEHLRTNLICVLRKSAHS